MDTNDKPQIAILCWEASLIPRGLYQLETLIGNSTNLDNYPFPVKLCRIEGANYETVVKNPSPIILSRMIEKARELSSEGIKAITTSCGFNAVLQKKLAEALDIPVFTSSLLQVPYLHNILPKNKSIAVIVANKDALKKEHLDAVGINQDMNIVVSGLENCTEWKKIHAYPDKDIDLDAIATEVVAIAINAARDNPDIGAFVMECTDLPPFSQAIREATGRPVLDFITMMRSIAGSIGVIKIK